MRLLETFLHFVYTMSTFRDVAQLVARLVWDQNVTGSNPAIPIKK
jgi:hypothetical protein